MLPHAHSVSDLPIGSGPGKVVSGDHPSLYAPVVADPGTGAAVPVGGSAVVPFDVGAGAETGTLADPGEAGLDLYLATRTSGGGTRTVTAATAVNDAGALTLAFTTGCSTHLRSYAYYSAGGVVSYAWRIIASIATAVA